MRTAVACHSTRDRSFAVILLLVVAVSVGCASPRLAVGDPPSGVAAPVTPPTPALGRVVTEIDKRIWVIYQDRRGHFWFGSNGTGVYRYDGRRMIHYGREDGLGGDQVRDIREDRDGNVFISTNSAVARFDGTDFTILEVVDSPPDGSGWRLDPDDVWLVFEPGRNGPCRVDGDRLYRLTLPRSPVEDEFSREPGRRFTPAGVYRVYRDRRGHLWFGTAGVGVCRYDGQALSWLFEERLTTTPYGGAFGIRSVYQDRAGDYWICNTRQRFKVSGDVTALNGNQLIDYDKAPGVPGAETDTAANFEYFSAITEDVNGTLWMACGSAGVWRFDGDEITKFTVCEGSFAIEILCDRQGTIWVGTVDHGVYRFDGGAFELFEPACATATSAKSQRDQ